MLFEIRDVNISSSSFIFEYCFSYPGLCVCVCLYMKMKIALSNSVKNYVGIFMGISLNVYIAFLVGWPFLLY